MGDFIVERFKGSRLRLEFSQCTILKGEQSQGLRNCTTQGVRLEA